MGLQKNSPFKYSFDEIFDAAADPVINHLYHTKHYSNSANKNFMNKFREYANMSGYLEEIKKNNCRLQNIYPYDDPNGKFISYIFEFPEGNLLCSLFSQIIRIKLTNGDRNHIRQVANHSTKLKTNGKHPITGERLKWEFVEEEATYNVE